MNKFILSILMSLTLISNINAGSSVSIGDMDASGKKAQVKAEKILNKSGDDNKKSGKKSTGTVTAGNAGD